MKRFRIVLTCALFLSTLCALCGCLKQQDATRTQAEPTPSSPTSTQKTDADPSQNPASPLFGWINFSRRDGKFSILFPAKPQKQEEETDQIEAGEVQVHLFIAETSLHYAYGVAYYDLPGTCEPKLDLAKLEESIVKKVNGKIVSARTIQVGDYPAAEYEIILADKPKFSGSGRMILVGRRVYELAMVYYTGDPNPDVRDAFFNSFTLQTD